MKNAIFLACNLCGSFKKLLQSLPFKVTPLQFFSQPTNLTHDMKIALGLDFRFWVRFFFGQGIWISPCGVCLYTPHLQGTIISQSTTANTRINKAESIIFALNFFATQSNLTHDMKIALDWQSGFHALNLLGRFWCFRFSWRNLAYILDSLECWHFRFYKRSLA